MTDGFGGKMDEWEGLGRRDQRTMSLGWGLGATELFFSLWFYWGGVKILL